MAIKPDQIVMRLREGDLRSAVLSWEHNIDRYLTRHMTNSRTDLWIRIDGLPRICATDIERKEVVSQILHLYTQAGWDVRVKEKQGTTTSFLVFRHPLNIDKHRPEEIEKGEYDGDATD